MTPSLKKLLSISKPTSKTRHDKQVLTKFIQGSNVATELSEVLSISNGFYAFESALHIFGTSPDRADWSLEEWNSPELWRSAYGNLDPSGVFFGEDLFGGQFLSSHAGIFYFDPETAEAEHLASSLEEWAMILLDEYDFYTGHSLAHEWQIKFGKIENRKRVVPKIPFALGGEFELSNLRSSDAVEAMKFRGDLANQLQKLPDGQSVRLQLK